MAFFPVKQEPEPEITFQEAANFVMPYGEHKDKKLDDIPLRYLDWAYGEFEIGSEVQRHIEVYVTDPHIAKMIEDEVNG